MSAVWVVQKLGSTRFDAGTYNLTRTVTGGMTGKKTKQFSSGVS